jgi:hypothetical protein
MFAAKPRPTQAAVLRDQVELVLWNLADQINGARETIA